MKPEPTGRAQKNKSAFRLEHAVAVNVRAKPEILWSLLTDAAGFPAWNSTVTRIDGEIAKGNRLALRVPAAPERVFKPKVTELEPGRRMVWSDGMAPMFKGVRTFTLEPREDGSTDFTMVEVFTGLMLPMIAGSLPDFGPAFEQYSADLKREGERRSA
ncbi:MAG: SRPBCC domain-containing protein [Sandaracinaceae bacterium]|nr:SRPBCC domain-containing protein [Sandaracinaceae bacterium]